MVMVPVLALMFLQQCIIHFECFDECCVHCEQCGIGGTGCDGGLFTSFSNETAHLYLSRTVYTNAGRYGGSGSCKILILG
jgi:hypothetical protein